MRQRPWAWASGNRARLRVHPCRDSANRRKFPQLFQPFRENSAMVPKRSGSSLSLARHLHVPSYLSPYRVKALGADHAVRRDCVFSGIAQRDFGNARGSRWRSCSGSCFCPRDCLGAATHLRRRSHRIGCGDVADHEFCFIRPIRLDAWRIWDRVRPHAPGRHRYPLSEGPLPRSGTKALPLPQRITTDRR